ncbi:MAG: hypothetical protein ACLUNZ_00385 [Evtepia sp.]
MLGPSLGMRGILIAAALSYGALSCVQLGAAVRHRPRPGAAACAPDPDEAGGRRSACWPSSTRATAADRTPLTGGPVVVVLDCEPSLAAIWSAGQPAGVRGTRRFSAPAWSGWPALPWRGRTCACCPTSAVGVPPGAAAGGAGGWGSSWQGANWGRCWWPSSPTPVSDGRLWGAGRPLIT